MAEVNDYLDRAPKYYAQRRAEFTAHIRDIILQIEHLKAALKEMENFREEGERRFARYEQSTESFYTQVRAKAHLYNLALEQVPPREEIPPDVASSLLQLGQYLRSSMHLPYFVPNAVAPTRNGR